MLIRKNLNQIKNAIARRELNIVCKYENVTHKILHIMWKNGYILGYRILKKNYAKDMYLQIFFKYFKRRNALKGAHFLSGKQKTAYLSYKQLLHLKKKKELLVLSTTKGILSHIECLKNKKRR